MEPSTRNADESLTIEIAKPYGFCFGVKRAVQIAVKAAGKHGRVSTFGPLIHNPQEVARLAQAGIRSFDSFDNVPGKVVVIRSHGATTAEIERLRSLDLTVIDATCPLVTHVQRTAKKLSSDGYQVLLLGEASHPEVKAILSRAEGVIVVRSETDIAHIRLRDRVGIVSQTTQSPDTLARLVYAVARKSVRELLLFNTICSATADRQQAAADLARRVDCMFILGGRNSANTRRLTEICKTVNAAAYHLETYQDLEPIMFRNASRIGVAAGASTPDWIVSDFVRELRPQSKPRTAPKGAEF